MESVEAVVSQSPALLNDFTLSTEPMASALSDLISWGWGGYTTAPLGILPFKAAWGRESPSSSFYATQEPQTLIL